MSRFADRQHKAGAATLVLLGLALFLRVLVPSGWMPASDGSFTIMLCPADGPVPAPEAAMAHHGGEHAHAMDQTHGSPDQHDSAQIDPDCAFAPLGGALSAPPLLAQLDPATSPAAAPALPAYTTSIGRGLAAPPPPSTGPPALS